MISNMISYIYMGKIEKLIQKVLQNRTISYNDVERLLKNLGFEMISCGIMFLGKKATLTYQISVKS